MKTSSYVSFVSKFIHTWMGEIYVKFYVSSYKFYLDHILSGLFSNKQCYPAEKHFSTLYHGWANARAINWTFHPNQNATDRVLLAVVSCSVVYTKTIFRPTLGPSLSQ